MGRLKLTDPSILQIYELSLKLFKSNKVDDKLDRYKMDITSGKIIVRNNLKYNRETKIWEQVGREGKIIVEVSSQPISYERTDTVSIHKYPVTFLLKKIDLGLLSPFKYRSGSEKKPNLPGKGDSKETRVSKTNLIIRNGIDLHFFFHLMVVLKINNLLFGRDTTNGKIPKFTNKDGNVYFEKHSLFCVEKILVPMFSNKNFSLNSGISN